MRPMHLFSLVLLSSFIFACQSTPENAIQSSGFHQYLHDDLFPQHRLFTIETPEQVFALDEAAKLFVQDNLKGNDHHRQIKALMHKIFHRSEFNLLYLASANTTATETFHNRAANCLSMSIMAYAMAREAGYTVRFQDVMIPEYWTRRSGFSVLNGHVNLLVSPPSEPNRVRLFEQGLVVDFDPQATRNHFPKRFVTRATILAMFYNNKGADALLANSYTKAYAYFRAAIKQDPSFDSTWVNLGFLYRLQGFYQYAEASYKQALNVDEENLTAWENLAYLYQYTKREKHAEEILTWVDNKRASNPFYHFILGEQDVELGLYDRALSHYRRALKLDKQSHEIYFGLAKAYYALGEINRSEQYLRMAKRKASNDQDQQRYQYKLSLLSRL